MNPYIGWIHPALAIIAALIGIWILGKGEGEK